MQDKGLVSIITPTYNCAKFIGETIDSIIAQTYENWELIIVDDNSSDNTEEIVKQYKDSRIKYYRNDSNKGAAVSRNFALSLAKGKWIAFLDSDDLWLPSKLEKQIGFMVKNNYFFTYHGYKEIDEESKEIGIYVGGKKKVSKFDMYACCWPGCLSVMYDAEHIGLIQINDVKKNNDTAMWLKAIMKSNCHFMNESLALYRRRKGSITPISIKSRIMWHYRLFRDAENMSVPESFLWMCINIIGNSYKKLFYVKKLR